MPTITVADHAGACYGVQRALELVQKVAQQATGPVHTLGPLIHNPQVVEGLASQGVTVVDDVPTQAGSTLVLRTHGVVPQVEQTARDFGLDVVDATCPYVKRVHHAAERLQELGYQVLVVGEAGHPEVEAILGHAPGAQAVAGVEQLDGLELGRRVGVVVQTTQAKTTLDAHLPRAGGMRGQHHLRGNERATAGRAQACRRLRRHGGDRWQELRQHHATRQDLPVIVRQDSPHRDVRRAQCRLVRGCLEHRRHRGREHAHGPDRRARQSHREPLCFLFVAKAEQKRPHLAC